MTRQGLPQAGLNGGVPIGTVATPYWSSKHTEQNTILDAFGGDGGRMFIGLLKLWNQYNELPTPLLNMTELGNAVIYTPTMGATLDFAVPYKIGAPYVTGKMVDSMINKPGIAGASVELPLSEEYANGDTLTNNFRNGIQVRVTNDPITPFGEGGGFVHTVVIASDDPDDFIPHEVLEPGVRWVKIDNRTGESDTTNSALTNVHRGGVMMLSHKTGNSLISVNHHITSYADFSDISSIANGNNKLGLFNYQGMSPQDKDAIINYYNIGPDGKPLKGGAVGWMPSIINRMVLELAMMKEYSMTWSKSYSFVGSGGKRVTVPKGYYQWIKNHGSYHTYSSFRELPNLLKNITGNFFANRKGLPIHERRVKFKMGMGAMIEVQKAFMEQFKSDNPFLIVNDGKNPQLSGILSGSSQNLSYKPMRITSVQFPEVGEIEIEHNPALDYVDNIEEIQSFTGAFPNSSYMIFVEDITESSFSNMMPRGAETNVAGGFNNGTNVVQVRPKGFYDTISFIPGVGCNPTLRKFIGGSANSQVAATKDRGFSVVMETCGEIFVKDPSRTVLIEYVPNVY